MSRPIRFLSALTVVVLLGVAPGAGDYAVASFSNMTPGGEVVGWDEMRLGNVARSRYTLVRDGGSVVVRGEADGSASGLIRRIDVDPRQFPVLTWRWKAEGVLPRGDIRRRDGDDYPARIYVTFDYDRRNLSFGDRVKYRALQALGYRDIPVRALSYVWANRPGETQIVPNPFTDWVHMVPVESGPANTGRWRTARRDILEDYRAAFGEEPPAINGVAIMTDADNTGGSATAFFGDIRMSTR